MSLEAHAPENPWFHLPTALCMNAMCLCLQEELSRNGGRKEGGLDICRFCFGEDLRSGRGAMEMQLEMQQLKQSEARAHIGTFRAERDAAHAEMSALRAELRSEQAENEEQEEAGED